MHTVKSDPHSSGEVWRALRAAAPQTVPVFAGYLVLGMGYGLVEREQKESSLRRLAP